MMGLYVSIGYFNFPDGVRGLDETVSMHSHNVMDALIECSLPCIAAVWRQSFERGLLLNLSQEKAEKVSNTTHTDHVAEKETSMDCTWTGIAIPQEWSHIHVV